ncbi:MAG: hypothetical protein R2742_03855 [Micropruina glycogenica]
MADSPLGAQVRRLKVEPKTEMLETGIKVLDLLTPYVKGGKIGLFGGAGGQDRAHSRDDLPHRPQLRGTRCSPVWASAPVRATT